MKCVLNPEAQLHEGAYAIKVSMRRKDALREYIYRDVRRTDQGWRERGRTGHVVGIWDQTAMCRGNVTGDR